MFPGQTGLFNSIPCPSSGKCQLKNCLFSHEPARPRKRPAQSLENSSDGVNKDRSTKVPKLSASVAATANGSSADKKPRTLVPEMIPASPAPHQQRVRFVAVIRDHLSKANCCYNPDTKAVELEADAAKRSTAHTYSIAIRTIVRQIDGGQYKEDVHKVAREAREIYREELAALIIPAEELKKRYIVEPPEPEPLESTLKTNCDRCGTNVIVGDLTGRCQFHLLRRKWEPNNSAKGGRLSDFHPCCGEAATESKGCIETDTHVFKISNKSLLAGATVQFIELPKDATGKLFAVGLDCEMAYTTRGMEMVRLTVVDYDTGKLVMDRLVRPFGKILDLNTRFSGVSDIDAGITIGDKHYPTMSFEDVMDEFFSHVNPSTIFVGHGLENDMNVMRLIHNRIVDTAMLYPRVRTRTFALKQLAWTFLGRTIQSGEHDSMEDSLAAIDIVKADIKQRSSQLK